MKLPRLGPQELEILNYISDNAPISVRDAARVFEQQKGLARTTVLTVMERLRKKGLLTRKPVDGVFHYSPKIAKNRVLQQKVVEFVKQTLGGSIAPVLHYFGESADLTTDELQQLKALLVKMEQRHGHD